MSAWAGIKKALNSTLGTSKFKSLDCIIDEIDKRGKRFISSDTVLARYTYEINQSEQVKIKFVPSLSGTVKFVFTGSHPSYNSVFELYENGVLITTKSSYDSSVYLSQPITDGATYEVVAYNKTGSANRSVQIDICGSISQVGYNETTGKVEDRQV